MTSPLITDHDQGSSRTGAHRALMMVLLVASGAAALSYQVLWVRELGLIVGSTAQAAALAVAIFFAGIALGGWIWGRRAARASRPLRAFGWLEIGVALTALGHLVMLDIVARLPAVLHPLSGAPPIVDLVAKVAVATVILLPPAILMGGTLPMMTEHLLRFGGRLGQRTAVLYAVNTGGAAIGAVVAGFVLPPMVGYRTTYLVAVGVDLTVGIVAVVVAASTLSRRVLEPRSVRVGAATLGATRGRGRRWDPATVWVVAAVSGTATLAVEVLWTRLFSQVLQNSVQTYALVLSTFLLALSLGALVASWLCRVQRLSPVTILAGLLLASSVAVAVSGPLFVWATEGVRTVGVGLDWLAYLVAVASTTMTVILVPGVIIGSVLPFLLRLLERDARSPGELVGRLVAVNTLGAIGGALGAGFVLLPAVGTARALLWCAAVYPLLAVFVVVRARRGADAPTTAAEPVAVGAIRPLVRVGLVGVAVVAAGGLAVSAASGSTPAMLDPAATLQANETLVDLRDGPAATVTVVDRGGGLTLRVNRTYILGGSATVDPERDQVVLPMLLHPDPQRVFTLGMGTGISAGAALGAPVDELVVCELIGDVVDLAREHFGPWSGGLFTDPRATVVVDDGRSCLQRSDRRYDVVVSDLFIPWQAGTGSLYTRDMYAAARARIDPGGLFVQWLPLYQIGRDEFEVVAATMDDVFDDVVMVRGDLYASRSIVGLIGSVDGPIVFDPDVIADRAAIFDVGPVRAPEAYVSMVARMYVGNITHSGLVADAEVDTDAKGLVELRAPRTHRSVAAGNASFLVGAERERLYADLARSLPLDRDPALQRFNDDQRGAVAAGRMLSRAAWERALGRRTVADQLVGEAEQRLPAGTREIRSPSRALMAPPRFPAVLGR